MGWSRIFCGCCWSDQNGNRYPELGSELKIEYQIQKVKKCSPFEFTFKLSLDTLASKARKLEEGEK